MCEQAKAHLESGAEAEARCWATVWNWGLAGAFVAVVIAIVLIITMTTGYIAKVDGLKIYDYEYNFFLQQAMYDIAKEIGIDPKA